MRVNNIFFILLASVGLTACTATGSGSFKDMSSAYREVVEQYSTDNILLNIVRASNNMPLSFLDIPSVVGSGNMAVNASLDINMVSSNPASVPGFFSATNLSGASSKSGGSVGMSVNNGFTFTQASLDNSAFMLAFLKEIPIEYVDYKGTERLRPKSVEYSLLIDSIELSTANGDHVIKFINDPMAPHYQKFQEALLLLIEVGLRSERRVASTPVSPLMNETAYLKYSQGWGDSFVDNLVKGTLQVVKKNKNGVASYQIYKNNTYSVMCVNKYQAQQLFGDLFSEDVYCENSAKNEVPEAKYSNFLTLHKQRNPNLKNMKLGIKLRSVGNIFDYLGSVMLVEQQNPAMGVLIHPSKNLLQSYYDSFKNPSPLLKIYKNDSSIKAVTSVTYKGDVYSIADNDDSYSKIVIEYLSNILTLAKVPGSIPASPAIVVR